MSLMISDPSRSAAQRRQVPSETPSDPSGPGAAGDAVADGGPGVDDGPGVDNGPGGGSAQGWVQGWVESWAEDEPEPVAAPRPHAPTVPLVGDAPAVPPTHRVAPFAPIRAGGGRHRLPASVRRRPGPVTAGLLAAATTLAVGALRGPQPPSTGHTGLGVPATAQVGVGRGPL